MQRYVDNRRLTLEVGLKPCTRAHIARHFDNNATEIAF